MSIKISNEYTLCQSCEYGDIEKIKQLLTEDFSLFHKSRTSKKGRGNTPIHIACRYGHINIVKLFIEQYGVSIIYLKNEWKYNSLYEAIYWSQYECIKYLIKIEPNILCINTGQSLLGVACNIKDDKCVEIILRYIDEIPQDVKNLLGWLSGMGLQKSTRKLIEDWISLQELDIKEPSVDE